MVMHLGTNIRLALMSMYYMATSLIIITVHNHLIP